MHRVMVRNPVSGDGEATDRAAEIARDRGIEVRDSGGPGEIVSIARDAAAEADQLLACGGDGTINEVVRGLDEADALDRVELAVVPAGTGNGFAGNVGVGSVEDAFAVATDGERRRLDLGVADGRPFLNSCMGGLVAEASEDTSDGLKERLGSLAYVLQTLAEYREYDCPSLTVRAGESGEPLWHGEAEMLLVGNARRFFEGGRGQADVEDGLLEVTVIEEAPAIDYLAHDALERLLDREAEHVRRLATARLAVETDGDPMEFSLDGETVERTALDAAVREGALAVRVGEDYEPDPPDWPAE